VAEPAKLSVTRPLIAARVVAATETSRRALAWPVVARDKTSAVISAARSGDHHPRIRASRCGTPASRSWSSGSPAAVYTMGEADGRVPPGRRVSCGREDPELGATSAWSVRGRICSRKVRLSPQACSTQHTSLAAGQDLGATGRRRRTGRSSARADDRCHVPDARATAQARCVPESAAARCAPGSAAARCAPGSAAARWGSGVSRLRRAAARRRLLRSAVPRAGRGRRDRRPGSSPP
jgi:hypothetical protein